MVSTTGPGSLATQPDPVLTNVMADASLNGGWIADILAPVHSVAKDFFRYGKRDVQSLFAQLIEATRTPGMMPNKLTLAITEWLTAIVGEKALRVEITQEDIDNSVIPEQPSMDAAVSIQNGLRFAIEALVYALFQASDTTNFPVAVDSTHGWIGQSIADAPWDGGSATRIQIECAQARTLSGQNGGIPVNTVVIPPAMWPAVWGSAEVQKAIGAGFRQDVLAMNGGLPPGNSFFGLKLLVPGARTDTTPTGVFTPNFVWADRTVRFVYTPSPNGEPWNGSDPTAAAQFENQKNGTAFEARQMLDPKFAMNGITHVWGNVRRSAPILIEPKHAILLKMEA